jgi:hypothetical protein
VPPRINATNRRTSREFYTFISSAGSLDLVADLKSRKISSVSVAVTDSAFNETHRGIRAAGMKWHDLRSYFLDCFPFANTKLGREEIDFMCGYVVKEDDLTRVRDFFKPDRIKRLREGYAQVEKQFFA